MTVYCQKPGCGRSWERDPILEVPCPACGAPIGAPCKRPSGHPMRPDFHGFGYHADRDLAAERAGHYGVCPSGRCGSGAGDEPTPTEPQLTLF